MTGNIEHQLPTKAICNNCFRDNSSILPCSNYDAIGKESSPQSLTAYSLNRSNFKLSNQIEEKVKRVLLVLYVIIFCTEAFSQNSKVSVGIVLSPPFMRLSSDQVLSDKETQYNYSAGLSTDCAFNSLISLKSVIFYEKKLIKNEIYGTDENNIPIQIGNVSFNYDYLILPILGSFSSEGKITLHFDAGPYFGYLINQKTTVSSLNTVSSQLIEGEGIRKKIDFGITLVSGLLFPINNRFIFDLGLQANFGLINISKNPDADKGPIKTNSVGLIVGLKYKL
jgi:hypothetical protein